jgi:deoxyadenosine/deoxycytidine kinase
MEFASRKNPTAHIDIVDIQGNIAAGKSSIATQVEADPCRFVELLFKQQNNTAKSSFYYTHVCVVQEPIDKWTCVGTDNEDLLASMYADPRLNGMAFQMNVVNTQIEIMAQSIAHALDAADDAMVKHSSPRILVITERSTLCGRHIFAQMNHDNKRITPAHWKVYNDSFAAAHALWRENISKLFANCGGVRVRVLGTAYLRISPEQAAERAVRRNRPADRDLPLAVFQELERRHEALYGAPNSLIKNPVTIVDSATLSAVLERKLPDSALELTCFNQN